MLFARIELELVVRWQAPDVEIRLGAGSNPLGARVRMCVEATIPGTVATADGQTMQVRTWHWVSATAFSGRAICSSQRG